MFYFHVPVMKDKELIPFKSTGSGRTTLKSYADPGEIPAKSSIPFRVSRFPLKIIMGNGERETNKLRIQFSPRFTGQVKVTSSGRGWLFRDDGIAIMGAVKQSTDRQVS
jgi:hypothetical protein